MRIMVMETSPGLSFLAYFRGSFAQVRGEVQMPRRRALSARSLGWAKARLRAVRARVPRRGGKNAWARFALSNLLQPEADRQPLVRAGQHARLTFRQLPADAAFAAFELQRRFEAGGAELLQPDPACKFIRPGVRTETDVLDRHRPGKFLGEEGAFRRHCGGEFKLAEEAEFPLHLHRLRIGR